MMETQIVESLLNLRMDNQQGLQRKTSLQLREILQILAETTIAFTSFIFLNASAQTWVPLDSDTSMDPTY